MIRSRRRVFCCLRRSPLLIPSSNRYLLLSTVSKGGDLQVTAEVRLNRQIVKHGKKRNWEELLDLYDRNKLDFNHIHYTTALTNLSRTRFPRGDPRFLDLLSGIQHELLSHRGCFETTGARQVSNILEACGRIRLVSNRTVRAMFLQADQIDTAAWLFKVGNPRDISSILEAAAKLRIYCPNLLAQLDARADWFLENARSRELATCLWSCARLNFRSESLLKGLESRCSWICDAGDPKDIARVSHACAKFNLPYIISPLQKYAQCVVNEAKPEDVTETVISLASLGVQHHNLWTELETKAGIFSSKSNPKYVAEVVTALARIQVPCPNLMKQIGKPTFVQRLLALENQQSIADCVWAHGKLGVKSAYLFDKVDENAERLVKTWTPRSVSNCLWAFATLGIEVHNFVKEVDRNCLKLLKEPQAIANSVWACAKLRMKAPLMFKELDNKATRFVAEASAQAIANSVWSCATLKVRAPRLFSEVNQHPSSVFMNAIPQNVANVVWAFATMGEEASGVLDALEERATWMASEANGQHLANCAWACAKLNYRASRVFRELDEGAALLFKGSPQNVSQSLWACATLKYSANNLFAELELNAESFVRLGSPQAVANAVGACETLYFPCPNLIEAINQNAKRLVDEGTPESTSAIILSSAKLDMSVPALFAELERPEVIHEMFRDGSAKYMEKILFACAKVGYHSKLVFAMSAQKADALFESAADDEKITIAGTNELLQHLELRKRKQDTEGENKRWFGGQRVAIGR